MVSPSINKKLLLFLFLGTLDLEYSKQILKQTILKMHSSNEKLEQNQIFSNTIKKILSLDLKASEVLLESFTEDCKKIFETNEEFNLRSWFLFFKTSIRQERETFILSQILKIGDSEIANLLNLTPGTVRIRIISCYSKLNEAIKNG